MQKIRLNRIRNIGDLITGTFVFIRQEFKSLICCYSVLVLPLVLLDMIFKSTMLKSALAYGSGEQVGFDSVMGQTMLNYLTTLFLVFWVTLETISYMRVYYDRYSAGEESPVSVGDVWRVMLRNLGKMLGWNFLFLMIVILGCFFLFIPGIYLFITFSFTSYFLVIKDIPFDSRMFSTSFIQGEWWSTFGFYILLVLIVGVMSYVFSLPYVVVTMTSLMTGAGENIYLMTFLLLLSSLGQNLLYTITVTGMGFKFFSILEGQEHTGLYEKIERLGENNRTVDNEGIR